MTRIALLFVTMVLFAGLLLAAASAHTTPDSLIGPDIPISTLDNQKLLPAAAYNWKHHEYLVVWHNKWPGNRDIYAQRVAETGELLSWFAVSAGPQTGPSRPLPMTRSMTAIWSSGSSTSWATAATGTSTGGSSPPPGRIPPWVNSPFATGTAANGTRWSPMAAPRKSSWLCGRTRPAGVPWYVSGCRVNAKTGVFPSTGSDITLAHPTHNRVNPDIAYNLNRNEYLVVWEEAASSQDIWALRMTGTALPLGGGEFAIAGWPDREDALRSRPVPPRYQYLVAWQSDVGSGKVNYDIYAWFLDGAGATVGAPLLIDCDDQSRGKRNYCLQLRRVRVFPNVAGPLYQPEVRYRCADGLPRWLAAARLRPRRGLRQPHTARRRRRPRKLSCSLGSKFVTAPVTKIYPRAALLGPQVLFLPFVRRSEGKPVGGCRVPGGSLVVGGGASNRRNLAHAHPLAL